MAENINPMIRFEIPADAARALDRFYRDRRGMRHGRLIRRAAGQRQRPEGSPQVMVASQFTYGVIEQQAKPGESIGQTIFRLAGGVWR